MGQQGWGLRGDGTIAAVGHERLHDPTFRKFSRQLSSLEMTLGTPFPTSLPPSLPPSLPCFVHLPTPPSFLFRFQNHFSHIQGTPIRYCHCLHNPIACPFCSSFFPQCWLTFADWCHAENIMQADSVYIWPHC